MAKKDRVSKPPSETVRDIKKEKSSLLPETASNERLFEFRNIFEFLIVIFAVCYSFFCFDEYLLDTVTFGGSFVPLYALFIAEVGIAAWFFRKKFCISRDLPTTVLCIAVFAMIFLYMVAVSPSFLPISKSADYPHHYLLIEYITSHESLPPINYDQIGEMAQYPFGASLATASFSNFFGLSILNGLALLSAIILGFILVCSYLVTLEILKKSKADLPWGNLLALAAPLMVLSLPLYFIEQVNQDFYYSMVWGELLILVCLLLLLKAESGSLAWLYPFLAVCVGIVYTYTLYIVIPFAAVLAWLILNREKTLPNITKTHIAAGLAVVGLFLVFALQRFTVGRGILGHEGDTIALSVFNFNFLFLALIILGAGLGLYYGWISWKGPYFLMLVLVFLEVFAFLVLNNFGMVARYFANKNFYLLILLLSPLTAIPFTYIVSTGKNEISKRNRVICGLVLIFVVSVFCLMLYSLAQDNEPAVNNNDISFSENVRTYISENNIAYENLTISNVPWRAYWSALLLHVSKDYADKHYLGYVSLDDWLSNPESPYLVAQVQDCSLPGYLEINGTRVQKVICQDSNIFLKKAM
ncbi:MAG: hypothetical protein WC342_07135 [Methanoregula sp.]